MLSIYLFLQEKKYQVNKEESYPNLMGRQYFEEKKKAKNLHANIRNLYLLFRQTASQLYIQGLKYVKGTALSHTSDFIIKRKQEMNTKWDFRPSDRATHIPCNMPPGKRFTSGTAQWGKALADKPDNQTEFYPSNLQTHCPLTTTCRFMPTHVRNIC